MILERIAFLLEQSYRHQAFHSHCVEVIANKLNHIANVLGEPNGRVTFSGHVDMNAEDVKKALANNHELDAEAIRMKFHFGQMLYMSILPEMSDKVKKALDESQLTYLRDTFEDHKKLNYLMEVVEERTKDALDYAEAAKQSMSIDVRSIIQSETVEEKQRLQVEYAKGAEERKKMEAATRRLDIALKEVEDIRARASNIVKASESTKGRIATVHNKG